jgi:hypothetical protein
LENANSDEDKIMALALCWTWGSRETLLQHFSTLQQMQSSLSDADTNRQLDLMKRARSFSRAKVEGLKGDHWFAGAGGPALFACLEGRLPEGAAAKIVDKFELFSRPVSSHGVLDRLWSHEAKLLADDPGRWDQAVDTIEERYESHHWMPSFAFGFDADARLPFDVARTIVKNAGRLPVRLVSSAEATCMSSAQVQLKSVGEIAARDNWFKQSH